MSKEYIMGRGLYETRFKFDTKIISDNTANSEVRTRMATPEELAESRRKAQEALRRDGTASEFMRGVITDTYYQAMDIIKIFSKDYINNPDMLKKIRIANDIINSKLQEDNKDNNEDVKDTNKQYPWMT